MSTHWTAPDQSARPATVISRLEETGGACNRIDALAPLATALDPARPSSRPFFGH